MPSRSHDTIAAMATPPGQGGIAVLRISGPSALPMLRTLFRPLREPSAFPDEPPRTSTSFAFIPRHMHLGHILDADGLILDQVLAVFMPGPHSVTGEDVAEIHCHGGPGVTAALLEAAFALGARGADPGEFTRRAFFNGRIDLTQAEAVAELISAPSRQGIRLARAKLDGALGQKIAEVRARLDGLRAQTILAVDFPEEDVEVMPKEAFMADLEQVQGALHMLLDSYERARLWRDGITVVLAGRVNAGKSSLLNAFLGRNRAIVSAEPGTTRDYIEEPVSLGGMPVRLFDTAGLRPGGGLVEEEGIRRSKTLAAEADAVILVVDGRAGPDLEEAQFLAAHEDMARKGRILVALNKLDVCSEDPCAHALARADQLPRGDLLRQCAVCAVSAKDGRGLDLLGAAVRAAIMGGNAGRGGVDAVDSGDVAPNIRQASLLQAAMAELEELRQAAELGHPPDVLAVHLDAAARELDDVTGASSTEELLDDIFAAFCIGK